MPSELDRLLLEIRACRICAERPAGKALPHDPRPVLRVGQMARIAVCGQAPGVRVHSSGIPFTDPSGDRLRAWMGVSKDEFYDEERVAIIPMGFCFPGLDHKGADLPPRPECAPAWRARIFSLLPQLELVLLVGQYAQRWHLGSEAGRNLTETVGRWETILDATSRPRRIPLPHPSWRNNRWLRDNPWFEKKLLPRLRREVRGILERK
jgi:uracil-DNA glycosylase